MLTNLRRFQYNIDEIYIYIGIEITMNTLQVKISFKYYSRPDVRFLVNISPRTQP